MMESTIVEGKKSTRQCPVFWFDWSQVTKHHNADTLGIYKIPGTDYVYVLRLEDWKDKKVLVSWLQPDSLISCKYPQVAFLAADAKYGPESDLIRIKGKRLRTVMSYGLLCELPPDSGLNDGDDATDYFKVTFYDPEINSEIGKKDKLGIGGGEVAKAPEGNYPYYDIDAFYKYARNCFVEGEPILVMEKLEGCNGAFVFKDGEMHCRSRNEWKREFSSPPKITLEELIVKMKDEAKANEVYQKAVVNFKPSRSLWWMALEKCPNLRKLCEENPGYCVFGEVFGQVKKFFYGNAQPSLMIAAFDILTPEGSWMDVEPMLEMFAKYDVPTAPVIGKAIGFNFEELEKIATDMKSRWPGAEKQISEGICIRPMVNRWDYKLGRVHLKLKNPAYLEMKG